MDCLERFYIRALNSISGRAKRRQHKAELSRYYKSMPNRLARMRTKPVINVLFIVYEISKWKSELLYKAMKSHPRFNPTIGLVVMQNEAPTIVAKKILTLQNYFDVKGYDYVELNHGCELEQLSPDLIFYVEPYAGLQKGELDFFSYMDCVYGYITYGFHQITEPWSCNLPYHNACGILPYECESSLEPARKMMDNHGKYACVTGLPLTDELLLPASEFSDPWLSPIGKKKRIIWAPHHSILEWELFPVSTFLVYAEFMKILIRKHVNDVQFAIKPHPVLYRKLYEVWGKEKTEEYFAELRIMSNVQFAEGEYIGLFKHSDAIIHDCGSFTVEYMHTGKPCLFLLRKGRDYNNTYTQLASDCRKMHYLASCEQDIELFVNNVITDIDPKKEERIAFRDSHLKPNNGKSACENIIEYILTGKAE